MIWGPVLKKNHEVRDWRRRQQQQQCLNLRCGGRKFCQTVQLWHWRDDGWTTVEHWKAVVVRAAAADDWLEYRWQMLHKKRPFDPKFEWIIMLFGQSWGPNTFLTNWCLIRMLSFQAEWYFRKIINGFQNYKNSKKFAIRPNFVTNFLFLAPGEEIPLKASFPIDDGARIIMGVKFDSFWLYLRRGFFCVNLKNTASDEKKKWNEEEDAEKSCLRQQQIQRSSRWLWSIFRKFCRRSIALHIFIKKIFFVLHELTEQTLTIVPAEN